MLYIDPNSLKHPPRHKLPMSIPKTQMISRPFRILKTTSSSPRSSSWLFPINRWRKKSNFSSLRSMLLTRQQFATLFPYYFTYNSLDAASMLYIEKSHTQYAQRHPVLGPGRMWWRTCGKTFTLICIAPLIFRKRLIGLLSISWAWKDVRKIVRVGSRKNMWPIRFRASYR